jgi:hypothetical protein
VTFIRDAMLHWTPIPSWVLCGSTRDASYFRKVKERVLLDIEESGCNGHESHNDGPNTVKKRDAKVNQRKVVVCHDTTVHLARKTVYGAASQSLNETPFWTTTTTRTR